MEIEEALMLLDGEFVSHSGDEVANAPRRLEPFRPIAALLPFRWKLFGRAMQQAKKIAHDALRLSRIPI